MFSCIPPSPSSPLRLHICGLYYHYLMEQGSRSQPASTESHGRRRFLDFTGMKIKGDDVTLCGNTSIIQHTEDSFTFHNTSTNPTRVRTSCEQQWRTCLLRTAYDIQPTAGSSRWNLHIPKTSSVHRLFV